MSFLLLLNTKEDILKNVGNQKDAGRIVVFNGYQQLSKSFFLDTLQL